MTAMHARAVHRLHTLRQRRLGGIAKVAHYVALHTPADGVRLYVVTDERLAADVGVSERSVRRWREHYVDELGVLEALRYPDGHLYRWDLERLAELSGLDLTTGQLTGQVERPHRAIPSGISSHAPVDDGELRDAIRAVRAARPAWDSPGIAATLRRALARGWTLARALRALLASALDPGTRTPARFLRDGWWWDDGDPRHAPSWWRRRPAADPPAPEPAEQERQEEAPTTARSRTDTQRVDPPSERLCDLRATLRAATARRLAVP